MNKTKIDCIYKDERWLLDNYGKHKSIYTLARLANCHYRTIHNWMIKYGIERIGRVDYVHSEETKKAIRVKRAGRTPMAGKQHSEETKRKMSETRTGAGGTNWKGGKTNKIRKLRRTKEYWKWRKIVIEAAAGICQMCYEEKPLQAHHKISIHGDLSGIYEVGNGVALCVECHKKADRRVSNEQAG